MKNDRYIRQTTLKGFGPEKQEMLRGSSVLVVGVGGLGIPVLQYLNAMGIGTLGMVEQDIIEVSNLQRQVLFGEPDMGKPKLQVAYDRLKAMNSETELLCHDTFLTRSNALGILRGYDLIVDASDNFATRYLVNDACVMLEKPFVSGAIHGFEGQVSVFNYEDGPTYRCLFPTPPVQGIVEDCNINGVLGVIPGIVGTMQALETVKVLTRMTGVLKGVLLLYDGLDQKIRHIKFGTVPENKVRKALEDHYEQPLCDPVPTVEVRTLKNELSVNRGNIHLIDVRTSEEFSADGLAEAVNIPLEELTKDHPGLSGGRALYFVCRSGARSADAIRKLRLYLKDTPMFSVEGGMDAWQQQFGLIRKTN
jgi:adenylyltransferase/sulfurtransferase